METTSTLSRPIPFPMNSLSSQLRLAATACTRFATAGHRLSTVIPSASSSSKARVSESLLKENLLVSLSSPFPISEINNSDSDQSGSIGSGSEWIVGVDPDVSGALAILRPDNSPSGVSAEVYDAPYVQVMVGKRVRKRLDPRSIVQLLHSLNAPHGTVAYIEQSRPFPQDGKQGWWSGGFTYGIWLGVLVASGFSVTPISALSWKNYFELSRPPTSKDESRRIALDMFPSLAPLLKRKKDHGRAEALLIAAYGRNLRVQSSLNSTAIEAKQLQIQSS